MNKIEYEIRLNDNGRPYIHLNDDNLTPDDKFACIEITKYLIFELLNSKNDFPKDFLKDLAISGDMINGISDKFADLIKGQMDTLNDINNILDDDK